MNRIMLLPLTVNTTWKAQLADLANSLDDLLFVFDGRRRMSEVELQDSIQRWKDGAIYSVFDTQAKQHIGLCGWYAMNARVSSVYAWGGIGLTDKRPDEKELKRDMYQQLTDAIFGNVSWANWILVKTRHESKDAPILKDVGFTIAAEFKNYLFVDGKYVSAKINAIERK